MISSTEVAPFERVRAIAFSLSAREKPKVINATTASSSPLEAEGKATPPPEEGAPAINDTFSRSSKIMRSAVYLPKPLIADKRFTSDVAIAAASSLTFIPESTVIPILGPTPETEISFKNIFFSSIDEKP